MMKAQIDTTAEPRDTFAPSERRPASADMRILVVDLHCPAADWAVHALVALFESNKLRKPWIGWEQQLPDGKFLPGAAIVRAHSFSPNLARGADRIVFLYRDVRDTVVSLDRYFKIPASGDLAAKLIEAAKAWEYWATLVLRYETVRDDPRSAAALLAEHVGLPWEGNDSLMHRAKEYLHPQDGAHQCTHARSGVYADHLAAPVLQNIEARCAAWLIGHGYGCTAKVESHPERPRMVKGFEKDFEALQRLSGLGFKPRTILDVGASNGPWAYTCKNVFPHAIYYLAEPLPTYKTKLMVPNDGQQWHYLNIALGPVESELELTVPKTGFGSYETSVLTANSPVEGELVRVRQRTLDQMIEEGVSVPDLVKIDVQGYELHVLGGAARVWGRTEVFMLETSLYRFWQNAPSILDVIQYFNQRGYNLFDFSGEFRAETSGLLLQTDVVFVRKEGPLARSFGLTHF